jgi:hypothetical protein
LLWANGVGWYSQQALKIDPAEVTALFHALRVSKKKERSIASNGQGKVIPFPFSPVPHNTLQGGLLARARHKKTEGAVRRPLVRKIGGKSQGLGATSSVER